MVVGSDPNAVYMVMEFMDHELKALMDTMPRPFSTAEVCPHTAASNMLQRTRQLGGAHSPLSSKAHSHACR